MVRVQRWKMWVVACVAVSTMAGVAVVRVVAAEKKQDAHRPSKEQHSVASSKKQRTHVSSKKHHTRVSSKRTARTNAAGADEPMEREDHARKLADKHRYSEALKEYVWCLKEGDIVNPSFVGVHGSFLMSEIMDLGKKYPPAIAAFEQYRDSLRDALDEPGASRDNALDFIACNDALDEKERTLAAYEKLKISQPAIAEMLFEDAAKQMIRERRYADVVSGAGDISNRIYRQLYCVDGMFSHMSEDEELNEELNWGSVQQIFLEDAANYYEALIALDKKTEADAARDQILRSARGPMGYLTLLRHARRAEKPIAVQDLLSIARQKLKPKAFKKVEQA